MTIKEAEQLEPGIYEITFPKGKKSLGAIGRDEKERPWFAAANWTGSTTTQWDKILFVRRVISSKGYLPQ